MFDKRNVPLVLLSASTNTPSSTMPAIRSYSTSASQNEARQQFERSLNATRVCHNVHGRMYARGPGFVPYPEAEDVFIRSNTAVGDDDGFEDLGLSDFVIANRRVGRHRYERYRNYMNGNHLGMFERGLMDWDMEEQESTILEALLGYTASMGMMMFEQQELVHRRVCVGINSCGILF